MFSLTEIIGKNNLSGIEILDIGAMFAGDDTEIYSPLLKTGIGKVTGFEALSNECEKLNKKYNPKHKFFPYFVGDGQKKNFYITNTLMTSSLYEPNRTLIDLFLNLGTVMQVEKVEEVQTKRLDDISEIPKDIDYIKIDTQGSELEILVNGEKMLETAVAVHTEVEFVPLYKNQPLFGDIDIFLRSKGFVFHRFSNISGRSFIPIVSEDTPNKPLSQYLWADAVYVKDFLNLAWLKPEKILKLAVILHDIYRSFDLCHHILSEYDKITNSSLTSLYRKKLFGG